VFAGRVNDEIQTILSAAHYAAQKHANQKRKGAAAEPYLNHLIEVAHLVSTALSEPDANLVAAALLHDVIEDAGVTSPELIERFGQDVAALIVEMTDDKSLPKEERKQLQIEHALKLSVRAQTIKLADKISNLRTILSSPPTNWSLERNRDFFAWAKRVVDGLSAPNPVLKAEFENTVKRLGELHSRLAVEKRNGFMSSCSQLAPFLPIEDRRRKPFLRSRKPSFSPACWLRWLDGQRVNLEWMLCFKLKETVIEGFSPCFRSCELSSWHLCSQRPCSSNLHIHR
jgi:GTP diphosphokinase / guanosine-3',5'-bis(diphosphate) 3'-diphosphatase